MDTIDRASAGAILCIVKEGIPYVLIMVQNNAHYKRRKGYGAVIDIGPKGGVVSGESLESAALREVKEETGIDAKLQPDFHEKIHFEYNDDSAAGNQKRKIKKAIDFYLAFITQSDIDSIKLSEEHLGCRIVELGDAIRELKYENQKQVLRSVEKYLKEKRGE